MTESYTNDSQVQVGLIADYSLDGTLLSSFFTAAALPGALAPDYADNTLWEVDGPTRYFNQYTKTGTLLQTGTYADLNGQNGDGIEFNLPVPEPATVALFAFGASVLGAFRRRRTR